SRSISWPGQLSPVGTDPVHWYSEATWVPINTIGAIPALLVLLGMPALFAKLAPSSGLFGLVGVTLIAIAWILFGVVPPSVRGVYWRHGWQLGARAHCQLFELPSLAHCNLRYRTVCVAGRIGFFRDSVHWRAEPTVGDVDPGAERGRLRLQPLHWQLR